MYPTDITSSKGDTFTHVNKHSLDDQQQLLVYI